MKREFKNDRERFNSYLSKLRTAVNKGRADWDLSNVSYDKIAKDLEDLHKQGGIASKELQGFTPSDFVEAQWEQYREINREMRGLTYGTGVGGYKLWQIVGNSDDVAMVDDEAFIIKQVGTKTFGINRGRIYQLKLDKNGNYQKVMIKIKDKDGTIRYVEKSALYPGGKNSKQL